MPPTLPALNDVAGWQAEADRLAKSDAADSTSADRIVSQSRADTANLASASYQQGDLSGRDPEWGTPAELEGRVSRLSPAERAAVADAIRALAPHDGGGVGVILERLRGVAASGEARYPSDDGAPYIGDGVGLQAVHGRPPGRDGSLMGNELGQEGEVRKAEDRLPDALARTMQATAELRKLDAKDRPVAFARLQKAERDLAYEYAMRESEGARRAVAKREECLRTGRPYA